MCDAPSRPEDHFAAASRASALALPMRAVASSTDVGWTSLLVEVRESAGMSAAYESLATPDQLLVLATQGEYDLERFAGGVWRRAVRQAGSGALTPGGETNRIRWDQRGTSPIRTVHLFLPQSVMRDAVEQFHRAGTPHRTDGLSAVAFTDPAITHVTLSLLSAMDAGAPDLYAQAVAQYLATHLLSVHRRDLYPSNDGRRPGLLTDQRLARVVEYMTVHYRESLTLERLAAEAGISKFHFVRLFKAAVGETPHRSLVRLRLSAARQMLGDTDLTIAEIARASGYGSAGHFDTAFTRHFGRTPTRFRQDMRTRTC